MKEISKSEIRISKQIRNPNLNYSRDGVLFRISNFGLFRISNFEFRTLHCHELPCTSSFLFRRLHSGGRGVLSAQAQAGREVGVQHLIVAEISLGDAGERAIPEAAEELASYTSDHFTHFRGSCPLAPFFATKAKPAELRVVILDTSASMQATDESPSRFEKARAEALKWVDGLRGSDQMVVLQAGANTEVKQSATSEKAALRRALQACVCSDGPTRLLPALRMAESLVRDQRNAEIHLFSDGAVPELSEFENKALPLVYHRVGKSSENLASLRWMFARILRMQKREPFTRASPIIQPTTSRQNWNCCWMIS